MLTAPPRQPARAGDRAEADPAAAELAARDAELVAVEGAWRARAGTLSPAQFAWRPAPDRWSVGEHLAHLNLVDASYLPHLDRMIADGQSARARAAGRAAHAPPRHPWLGQFLVRSAEPPVRLKMRTTAAYVPAPAANGSAGSHPLKGRPTLDRDAVLGAFAAIRRALRAHIAAAAGLDPGRVRARFAPGMGPARFVILSLGQWLALTAAHDRRHLWLADRVREAPGFPPPSGGAL